MPRSRSLVGRKVPRKDIVSELDAIPRLRADARGRDGGVRPRLAAAVAAMRMRELRPLAGNETRETGRRPGAGPAPATAGLKYATRAAMPCCLPADDRGSTRHLPPLRDRGTRSSRPTLPRSG